MSEHIHHQLDTTEPRPRLFSVEVAGSLLGLKRSTTWEEIRLGRLKTVRVGRRRLVPAEYLDDYVEVLKAESMAHAS